MDESRLQSFDEFTNTPTLQSSIDRVAPISGVYIRQHLHRAAPASDCLWVQANRKFYSKINITDPRSFPIDIAADTSYNYPV